MRNFEALEAQCIYTGNGAPVFTPSEGHGVYLRFDTPTVANQRIYFWNQAGPAWVGVA